MDNVRKGNLKATLAQNFAVYNDGEVAFCRDIRNIESLCPVQLEIHVIVLVREGKALININGTPFEAKKNDLFICSPNNIIENALVSQDFKPYVILTSMAYVQRIIPLAENAWDLKMLFEKNPLCTLQPEEATIFCQYFELLCSKVQQTAPAPKKVIDTLMLAFFYEMGYYLNRVLQNQLHPLTSGESLFRRFIELLESSYPRQRTVTYYAERLNITPKYLSSVCKQASGQCPSTLIDNYVLRDIDYLMKHSQKNIKEIAFELGFPNLSFFGKYVKKHQGMSPKAYREATLQGEKNP